MDFLTLHNLFLGCAWIGGAIFALQTLLTLFGADDGTDGDFGDFDADSAGAAESLFFSQLSLKTVTAFLTFFGLAGLGTEEFGSFWQLVSAFGAGGIAFYVVGLVMASLRRLESSGNVDLTKAVGSSALAVCVLG